MKSLILTVLVLSTFLSHISALQAAEVTRLAPVKTDNPRETMRSFMVAMNDYNRGVSLGDSTLEERIDDAVRTLDLSGYSALVRQEKGREAAVLLKEVIDRVILIDYSKIPTETEGVANSRWRLKNTPITITLIDKGERTGEYLFSSDTVTNAFEMYKKVEDLPFLKGSGEGAAYSDSWTKTKLPSWSQKKLAGFFAWQWIGLILAMIFGFTGKFFAEKFLSKIKKFVEKTHTDWDDSILTALERPAGLICASAIWYVSLQLLKFEGFFLDWLTFIIQITFSFAVVWLAYRLSDAASDIVRTVSKNESFLQDKHLESLFLNAIKSFIVVFGVLVSLQNLGINVASLIAGLGIGGLAVALAAKDTAANFFGSIMILWDRPFKIGDWIVAAGAEGTVEEIGFRSTRIRTFYNSQICIANSQIANINIDNMGRRALRRIKVNLGIAYDTPAEKIEAFVEGVKNIVKANKATDKSNFHVVFNNYGDSALMILLYCFLRVPDWSHELVERQNLFIEIKRLAEDLEIEFAFPTQTLHVASTPEKPMAEQDKISEDELKRRVTEFGPQGAKSKPSGLGVFTPTYNE